MNAPEKEAVSFGELWSIQESLLQTYRKIFITLQAVLIAIEVILLSSNTSSIISGLPVLILGISLIPIWKGVCHARANAVAFIHWLVQKYEAGEEMQSPYYHFRQFQINREFNGKNVLQDENFKLLCRSKTRHQLDTVLPALFTFTWFLLFFILVLSVI